MAVLPQGEPVGRGDAPLIALDGLVFELHDEVARGADQVVVVLVRDQLEARRAAFEAALGDDAALLKDPQRAVHGGRADAGVTLAHLAQELVGGDVALHIRERVEDELATGGGLELVLRDVLAKAQTQGFEGRAVHLDL